MLERYPISDLLSWIEDETLTLNPDFQRRSVWSPGAKTYLIDTILKRRPMPNIMIRTLTDLATRRSRREVVDGQQRLRTIRDFVNGALILGRHAGEYSGFSYTDLSESDRIDFLEYRIGVEQLINADDETVLDTFRRLNSYSYRLNAQELRHAGYMGEFRSAVVAASRKWRILWEKYNVVTLKRQLRMDDDQLMAEMFGVVMRGVAGGGQGQITRLYREHDHELDERIERRVDKVLKTVISELSPALETRIARAPHFLMLFAAVAHATIGIPDGQIENMPHRIPDALSDPHTAIDNLMALSDCLSSPIDEAPIHLYDFRNAASGATTSIASRSVRFQTTYKALMPNRI